MLYLGQMYWKGTGVKEDKPTAYMWILLAASFGLPEAKPEEAALQKELDAKEVQRVQRKAALWERLHPDLALRTLSK
jgi:TPR repeat protein